MRVLLIIFILIILNVNEFTAESSDILWWFDTNDSSFGQSAMEDIDGDGKYEIVFGCYRNDSMIYALNAEDGSLLWKYNTSGQQEGCNDVASLIYDADNDGNMEVFVPSSCNPYTYCFNGANGELLWKAKTRGSDSPPTISDLDGDDNFEIIHGEFSGYVISLDAKSGEQNWEILVDSNSWIQTAPTIVDLNSDGQLDFVVATWNFYDNNKIYAYNGSGQSLIWSYPLSDYTYHGTAIADLNNDTKPEIIIGDYSGKLSVIEGVTGDLLWEYIGAGYIGSPVSVADINSDGLFEIAFCSGYEIIVLTNNGELLWKYEIPDYATAFRGVALADVNDNNLLDIIFGTSKGKLIVLNGIDGSVILVKDLAAELGKDFDINHAPLIGDFDNNGALDAFVIGGNTNYPDFSNNYGRAYAIELGKGSGPDWKMFQHDIWRTGTILLENSSIKQMGNFDEQLDALILPYGSRINLGLDYKNFGEVIIYDVCGRTVYSNSKLYSSTINIQFAIGLYYIKFGNHEKSKYQKMLIY